MGHYEDIKKSKEDIEIAIFRLETFTFEDDLRVLIERRDKGYLEGFRKYITVADGQLETSGYIGFKKAPPLKPYELRSDKEREEKYERVLFHLRKAVNLLKLYEQANIYSKPLIGYYAIYSLAQIAFDLTFEAERDEHHGLSMVGLNELGGLEIKKHKFGLFQAFADSIPFQFGRVLRVLIAGQRLTFEDVTKLVVDYPDSGIGIRAFDLFFNVLPPEYKHGSMIHPIIGYYLYFYMLSNYARYPSALWQKKTNTDSSQEYYSILSTCENAMAGFLRFSFDIIDPANYDFGKLNQILTEMNIPSIR